MKSVNRSARVLFDFDDMIIICFVGFDQRGIFRVMMYVVVTTISYEG